MKQEVSKYEKKIAELHGQVETEARTLGEIQSRRESEEQRVSKLQKQSLAFEAQIAKQQANLEKITQDIERKRDEGEAALVTKRLKQIELTKSIEAAKEELAQIRAQIKEGKQLLKAYNSLEMKYETLMRKSRILEALMRKIEANTRARNEKAKKTLIQAMEIRDQANKHKDYWETQKASLENRERNVRVYSKRIVKYYQEQGLNPPTDL